MAAPARDLRRSCTLTALVLVAGLSVARAQPGYTATDLGAQPFATIAGTPGATLLAGVSACDDCTEVVPLPFTFVWYGAALASIAVSSNGQLNMDARTAAHCCTAPAIPAADGNDDAIFFAKQDLDPSLAGEVWTRTDGTPGTRTFTLEFQGVQTFMPCPTPLEVQVVLHEAPPFAVDILWGAGDLGGQAFSAGVEDAGGTDGTPAVAGGVFDGVGRATTWPVGQGCRFTPGCPGDCATPIVLAPTILGVPGQRSSSDVLALDTSACGHDSHHPTCAPPAGDGPDTLVELVMPFTGTARFHTCASAAFDTLLAVLDGTCAAAELACSDDVCGSGSDVTIAAAGGQRLLVVVDGVGGAGGPVDLTVELTESACSDCAAPLVWLPTLSGLPGARSAGETFHVDTAGCGGIDSHAPSCGVGGEDALIQLVAPFDGELVVATCASAVNTLVSILDGACGGAELACNDDDPTCGGAGQSRLTLAVDQGRTYTVVVDRSGGGSFAADVDLALTEMPRCGTCASPQPLALQVTGATGGRTATGRATVDTGLCATDSYATPVGCVTGGAPTGDDSVIEIVAPFDGVATCSTCSSATFDTVLVALEGSCVGSILDCNDDGPCLDLGSRVSFPVAAGLTYTLVVDGFGGAVGVADVDVVLVEDTCPGGGTCADPILVVPSVTGTPGQRSSVDLLPVDTRTCGLDNHQTSCVPGSGDDVVVQFVAPFTGEANASTCSAATFDTALAALDGGCGGVEIACDDDSCGPIGAPIFSSVAFGIQAGATYTVIVDGTGAGTATLTLELFERQCLQSMCGDCDENGSAPDVLDALEAARIDLGLIVATPAQQACCDVDASGGVTVLDALRIAQSAVGLGVALGCP